MRHFLTILLGLTLATATATTAVAQAPDWKQTLGGLLNGNQDRDEAIRQAYERGYQRGRNDEARQQRARESQNNPYDDRSGYYRDRGGYR